MNNNMLIDNENNVKYQIIVNGSLRAERTSKHLAEHFISGLTIEEQNVAKIVPITESGKQILLG